MNDGSAARSQARRLQVKRTGARPGPEWNFDPGSADPLLRALSAAMHELGRDIAPRSLIAGLALPADGRLTPQLALQAAELQGVRARLSRRALRDLPEALLPAVLFLKGREACVLLELQADTARVIWPARSDDPLTLPRAETPDHFITMAFNEDLDEAGRDALRQMLDLITARTNRSRAEAYMLCSLAADLRVTQMVNGNKGIHVMLAKHLLADAG